MHRVPSLALIGLMVAVLSLVAVPPASLADVAGVPSGVSQARAQELDDSPELSLSEPRPTATEQALLDLTNADRQANGLAPLAFDPATLEIARARASTQLRLPSLSHLDGQGRLAFVQLLGQLGVQYRLAGENLARSTSTSSDQGLMARVEEALMRSPTHRQNILEATFTRLAVGVATDQDGRVAFAQIFRATDS